jgi:signal transduction histidine kinase
MFLNTRPDPARAAKYAVALASDPLLGEGSGWRLPAVAALVAGVFSALVMFVRPFDVAYRSPALHVSLETLAAVIATVGGYLLYGRYRLSSRLGDLVLALALFVLASGSLFFSVIPAALSGERMTQFSTWAPVMSGLLGAIGFAVAAFVARESHLSGRVLVLVALGFATILLVTALVTHELATRLPVVVAPALSPVHGGRELVIGQPVVLALQLVTMGLFAIAALGFLRRTGSPPDTLMPMMSVSAVVAAFAAFNYFVFPSLFSEWVYSGDILRFAFYLVILVSVGREVSGYWRGLAQAAVLEERRRIARELHDGLAQELAFIGAQSRLLDPGEPSALLVSAADRALEESRRAIDALTRPLDEPVDVAVARAAEEIATRTGTRLTLELEPGLQTTPEVRDALRRIAREATINAARHGHATRIRVSLAANGEGLRLRISDDGSGFEPGVRPTGFGLVSMRERATRIGARLALDSEPGRGTTLEVVLP